MNKFKFNVILSLTMAALCTTLLYQNCAKTKYSQAAQNGVSGGLGSIDASGFLPVEVIVDNCNDPEDLEKPICQQPIKLNLYVEEGSSRSKIATIQASPKVFEEDGVQVVKYVGKFQIDVDDYECKTLVVTHESDLGEVDIGKIQVPGEACTEVGDGTFKIESILQDNRLFEASGKCTGSAKVVFSGNINADASKEAACTSSQFKYCSYTTKYGMNNTLVAQQGSMSDNKTIVGQGSASVFITVDDSYFNAATRPLSLNGRCTPNGDIVISIYGNKQPAFKCGADGKWSFYHASILVTTLTDRRVDIGITHALGSMNIYTNIDSPSAPNCSITATVAHPTLCKKDKNAGSVKGTCRTGLPIELKVNGKANAVMKCEGGVFEFKNVLLYKTGQSNAVSVHQIQTQPTGAVGKCDQTVNLTSF